MIGSKVQAHGSACGNVSQPAKTRNSPSAYQTVQFVNKDNRRTIFASLMKKDSALVLVQYKTKHHKSPLVIRASIANSEPDSVKD